MPLPPPSPTDDPLLLTGSPSRSHTRAAIPAAARNPSRVVPPVTDVDDDHWTAITNPGEDYFRSSPPVKDEFDGHSESYPVAGLVQVSSTDPRAAARAAAILNQVGRLVSVISLNYSRSNAYDSMTMIVSPGSQVHVLSHLAQLMLQDNGHGKIGSD